jgi:DNA repair protein RadC
LAAQFELGRRAAAARAQPGWRIRTPADVAERLVPAMRHLEREELRVLLLNTKNVVTAASIVYAGNGWVSLRALGAAGPRRSEVPASSVAS